MLVTPFSYQEYQSAAGKPNFIDPDRKFPVILGGGRFMLGQKINPIAEVDVSQTLRGDLADFLMYNTTLALTAMKNYTNCHEGYVTGEEMFKFDDSMKDLEVIGKTKQYNVKLDDVCFGPKSYQLLIPTQVTFNEAESICRSLTGMLTLPTSEEENTRIYDRFVHLHESCKSPSGIFYWLRLGSNVSEQQWYDLATGSSTLWENFDPNYNKPADDIRCAGVGDLNFPYIWYPDRCEYWTCPVCNFTHPPVVRLRGLCEWSEFDRSYYIYGYENQLPKYEGTKSYQIVWDNSTWVIKNRFNEEVRAVMAENAMKIHPLGEKKWKVTGDTCGQSQVSVKYVRRMVIYKVHITDY